MRRRAGTEINPLKKLYFGQEARRLAAYEREQVTHFAANIVCSELDAQRLKEVVHGVRVEIIPNGIDSVYFRPASSTQQPDSTIFVGTLDWYPNTAAVMYLLREIWPRLLKLRPKATLHIVGANAPPVIIRAARTVAGVTLHGLVPDVRPLIDSAAVYVCPIRDGGGTKLKILEACAMQKCIVATPVACEGINLQSGVSVELADAPESFVQSLVHLFDSPDKRAAMGRAARALAESEYSADVIGGRFVRVLSGCGRNLPRAANLGDAIRVYKSRYCWAHWAKSKRLSTTLRALLTSRRLNSTSLQSCPIACPKALQSPAGTSKPSSVSVMISGIPPTADAITAQPTAMASITT